MSEALVKFWDDDAPAEIVDEQCEKLQIATFSTTEATEGEAKSLHRKLLQSATNFMTILREIHDRKAFRPLGYSSFESYLASLRSRSFDPININYDKFRRLCIHDDVCDFYQRRDIDTRNLLPTHTELIYKELPETQWMECWERIMVHKRAYVPTGEALRRWHDGKILTQFVQNAIDDVKHSYVQSLPADPYADEDDAQANVAPLEPIFDATGDGKFVPDPGDFADRPDFFDSRAPVKYAPPPKPVSQKPPAPVYETRTIEETPAEICLAFVGVEPHEMDDDVLWIQGTDGPNVYAIPVRREQLREVLA